MKARLFITKNSFPIVPVASMSRALSRAISRVWIGSIGRAFYSELPRSATFESGDCRGPIQLLERASPILCHKRWHPVKGVTAQATGRNLALLNLPSRRVEILLIQIFDVLLHLFSSAAFFGLSGCAHCRHGWDGWGLIDGNFVLRPFGVIAEHSP
jgi:hypothetical protein